VQSAQLKQAQGSIWGSGPFEEIEVNLADMHDAMVSGIDPSPDEAWLDLGCGTGGVAGRAAAAGAKVTGVDLAPGGRIALSAWRPEGGIGKIFKFMRDYQPPMPDGIVNPLDLGREQTATALLGGSFDLEFESPGSPLVLESGEALWDLTSRAFGPTRILAASLDEPTRTEFRQALIEMAEKDRDGPVIRQSRPYLLIKGTRR